jgi:hypothetical protein
VVAEPEPTAGSTLNTKTGVSAESLARVKDEIGFFMEKTFQISFGYLGAMVALAAASSLDAADAIADDLGVGTTALFCTAILVVNAVYLSLASGTLFATIKRGLYLIQQDPDAVGHKHWETFVRRSEYQHVFRPKFMGSAAWNIDNFYMLPLFALIGVVSIAVAVVGLVEASDTAAAVAVSAGVALHALPLGMLVQTTLLALHVGGLVDDKVSPASATGD